MTKQELIKMVGSEEQAEYTLEIILKNLKPDFIRAVVQTELNEVDREINTMETDGYIVTVNGQKRVNWGKAMKLDGWNLSAEQQAEYEEAYKKCANCDSLLYKRNRLTSLIAIR